MDKIPTAFERRCIRAGRFASPVHAVKYTLHYVMCTIQCATPRLRSALLLGRIALLFTSRRALPARRLAALGARGALSTDCYAIHAVVAAVQKPFEEDAAAVARPAHRTLPFV